jgi:uncharacterized protein YodC (DUF2158 family)
MEIKKREMVYFKPGDLVKDKHGIENAPVRMVVIGAKKQVFSDNVMTFQGIECYWYSTQGVRQKELFNSKDLEKL